MTEDTFSRKALTLLPDGTIVERDWTKKECFHLYVRGFRDGAGARTKRKDHVGLGPYDRGYTDGLKAARDAAQNEAKRLDYKPEILREKTPPADGTDENG